MPLCPSRPDRCHHYPHNPLSRRPWSLAGLVMVTALTLATLAAPSAVRADTLQESTAGTDVATFVAGQSVTTGTGGPWNNITFNFFSDVSSTTPAAQGTLFLLSQEYLGTSGALSAATTGFLAQSTSNSGGIYTFSSSVTLAANTKYFFYANTSFATAGSLGNPYPGGDLYTSPNSVSPFQRIAGQDANFRLSGTPVASDAPEPGSLALLAFTGLPIAGAMSRRRTRRTA